MILTHFVRNYNFLYSHLRMKERILIWESSKKRRIILPAFLFFLHKKNSTKIIFSSGRDFNDLLDKVGGKLMVELDEPLQRRQKHADYASCYDYNHRSHILLWCDGWSIKLILNLTPEQLPNYSTDLLSLRIQWTFSKLPFALRKQFNTVLLTRGAFHPTFSSVVPGR